MPHVNGKVSAPDFMDGDPAMGRGSLTFSTITQKSIQRSKKKKKQNDIFSSFFLLLYTLTAAQEWIYMWLVHQEKPNLTLQVPEAPSLNGFPPPGAVFALQYICQGPRLCLVQYEVVNSH